MKTSRILFSLTLIVGIIIIGIGLFLKLSDQISWGTYSNRSGDISYGLVTGTSAFVIGSLLLILAFVLRINYKNEKEKLSK